MHVPKRRDAAEGMFESGARDKIAVYRIVLLVWCALGQLADDVLDFLDWVLHVGCLGRDDGIQLRKVLLLVVR
jgi:hypothetical protein